MTATLPYLLINVREIELQKVSVSDMQILKVVFSTVTVNDKYFLLNKDNLKQPIQIQLPQKQKTFSKFFSQLLQSA